MEEKLFSIQCPLNWDLPNNDHYYDEFLKKVKNSRNVKDFLIDGFCFTIIECFERIRGNELELALSIGNECKQMLLDYLPAGEFLEQDKYLWKRCSEGMWHVLYGTLAHLAYKENNLEMVEELLLLTLPAEILIDSDLATINAIKARILFEYGLQEPTLMAIECARKAVRLDDSVPLWHFLLGNGLARHRRANNYFHDPFCEEIEELEKAWKASKRPEYGAMLLQSYQNVVGQKVYNKFRVEDMRLKIEPIFREVQDLAGNKWYIYARLAHTAMRLPWNTAKPEKLKKLVDQANEYYKMENASDDPAEMSDFLLCLNCHYYKKVEKDFDKTLKYALLVTKSGAIGCAMDCITLSFQKNKEEDLSPLFDKFSAIFPPEFHKNKVQLSIYKANYLFFFKKDIKEALKIYSQVIEDGSQNHVLKKCPVYFQEITANRTFDVLEKVQSELNKSRKKSSGEASKAMYTEYLQQLQELVKKEKCHASKESELLKKETGHTSKEIELVKQEKGHTKESELVKKK